MKEKGKKMEMKEAKENENRRGGGDGGKKEIETGKEERREIE